MTLLNLFTFQSGEFFVQDSSFDWATIIAAVLATITVIIGYSIQKRHEREAKNRENSKEAYLKFLNDFTAANVIVTLENEYLNSLSPSSSNEELNKHKIESLRRKLEARNHLLLYGSDNVIQAYLNFVKHLDEVLQKKVQDKQEEFFTNLLIEIRKEIYKESKLQKEDISKYFNEYNRQ